MSGLSLNPNEMYLGPVDGLWPVAGLEDPAKRQLYVPAGTQRYETLLAADMADIALCNMGVDHVDEVIALSRGGMSIGEGISYTNNYTRLSALQISGYDEYNVKYPKSRIVRTPNHREMKKRGVVVIADDLIDTGEGMEMAYNWVNKKLKPKKILTVVLRTKARDHKMEADVSVLTSRDEWYDYAKQADRVRRLTRIQELRSFRGFIKNAVGQLEMATPDRGWYLEFIARSAGKYQLPESRIGDDQVAHGQILQVGR